MSFFFFCLLGFLSPTTNFSLTGLPPNASTMYSIEIHLQIQYHTFYLHFVLIKHHGRGTNVMWSIERVSSSPQTAPRQQHNATEFPFTIHPHDLCVLRNTRENNQDQIRVLQAAGIDPATGEMRKSLLNHSVKQVHPSLSKFGRLSASSG